ncbi:MULTISPECIES: cyclase family protein [unclassified Lysobacter]|uniref:cyclase family protein n=1 Tax=unclassified Lysobacter TaxID=2635362 RepID=UPI0007011D7D|nr:MULTISPECIES: cyclase family protein [unclassified Lysobacter]KRA19930.1 cyclase [Lysobacter sp. Root604]KRD74909.1 cyclase [Lysobacter sp. Root983]
MNDSYRDPVQHRVRFDFEIEFTNGGGIQGQDFRLDIDGDDIADAALVDYIVQDLRLLMVGQARILNKAIIVEAHKRKTDAADPGRRIYVDLSHTIEDGLVTYPGMPAARVCDYLSREASRAIYEEGTEFQIARIEMVANTGTYIDCPSHRYAHGHDLSELKPEACADLEGIVVRADHRQVNAIDASWFRDKELRGRAVLVHTGWDAHWADPAYAVGHPFLTEDAAVYLRECGVKLVGIDSMNIDDTRGRARPVHSTLLGADILIVEHLRNLAALPDEGFRFSAVPPKVRGAGTFPVRALARLD